MELASESLKNDKDLILAAVHYNSYAISFLPLELYQNFDFIKDCLTVNSYAIAHIYNTDYFKLLLDFSLELNPFIIFGRAF